MHRIEAYLTLAIILVSGISILYLPILFLLKKRGIDITRQLGYFALFCSVFLILFATIFFMPVTFKPEEYTLNISPFSWFHEANPMKSLIEESTPNIILFIPLGIFIPIVFKKTRKLLKTALIVLFVTVGIEIFQYFIGRSSDIDDTIMNLLGGVIGYGIFTVFSRLLKDKKWWNKLTGNDLAP